MALSREAEAVALKEQSPDGKGLKKWPFPGINVLRSLSLMLQRRAIWRRQSPPKLSHAPDGNPKKTRDKSNDLPLSPNDF
jgi:hypothetical protein